MAYQRVLGAALLCYAAVGAVLRVLPHHVEADLGGGTVAVGLAVGAPAMTGLVARPLGRRLAGLLALAQTEPARHGAAAGLFFAWFDAGVGLGGPAAGLLAGLNRTVRCAARRGDRRRLRGAGGALLGHPAGRTPVGKLTHGRKANPDSVHPAGARCRICG
jgi:hypothetical protein